MSVDPTTKSSFFTVTDTPKPADDGTPTWMRDYLNATQKQNIFVNPTSSEAIREYRILSGQNPTPLEAAQARLGMNEKRDNAELQQLFAGSLDRPLRSTTLPDGTTAGTLNPNDPNAAYSSWCAAFQNGIHAECGIKGSGDPGAKSFVDFVGSPKGNSIGYEADLVRNPKAEDLKPGDVIVIPRGGGQYHVTMVEKVNDNGTVSTIGGNQGDGHGGGVTKSKCAIHDIVGRVRLPDPSTPDFSDTQKHGMRLTDAEKCKIAELKTDPQVIETANKYHIKPEEAAFLKLSAQRSNMELEPFLQAMEKNGDQFAPPVAPGSSKFVMSGMSGGSTPQPTQPSAEFLYAIKTAGPDSGMKKLADKIDMTTNADGSVTMSVKDEATLKEVEKLQKDPTARTILAARTHDQQMPTVNYAPPVKVATAPTPTKFNKTTTSQVSGNTPQKSMSGQGVKIASKQQPVMHVN